MKQIVFTAFFLMSALILGCGSDGDSGRSLPFYITDDPGDQFPSVQITIFDANLCSDNDCQNTANLFHSDDGLTVDLAELDGILQYINDINVPDDTYNRLEIILDENAIIKDKDGVDHLAYFEPDTSNPNKANVVLCPENLPNRCLIRFNGAVQPFAMGKFIVDFDLKGFEVASSHCTGITDTNSWCITEVKMHPLTPEDMIDNLDFKVSGQVTVVTPDNFTVQGRSRSHTIVMNESTKCKINENDVIGASSCLPLIQVDMCLEIETSDDPALTNPLTAKEVETEDQSHCS